MGRVLLTGASGFIAAHVLNAFLRKGHFVRFTVRSQEKANQILDANKQYSHLLEAAIVRDIAAAGAFDDALKDNTLDGVIHTASPFHTNFTDPQTEILTPAIDGTVNILKAIAKFAPNVKRVVITSSFAAMIHPEKSLWPGHVYSEKDWNPVTIEQGKSGDKLTTYRASKTYAENAGWSFVEQEKPGFDLVTLNPPMVYGPVINDQTIASLNTSNQRIWKYLDGEIKEVEPMGMPIWVDVRDLADAHLAAYEKPNAGGKRFFIVADALYSYQELADILRKQFPERKDKIPEGKPGSGSGFSPSEMFVHDNSASKEILGITYKSFETCAIDTANSLLKLS